MASILDVKGIGPALAQLLERSDVRTVDQLAKATNEDLTALPGLGVKRATLLIDAARQLLGADGGNSSGAKNAPSIEPKSKNKKKYVKKKDLKKKKQSKKKNQEVEKLNKSKDKQKDKKTKDKRKKKSGKKGKKH